jgi:glycogen operon protein
VLALRARQQRNFLTTLFVSQGTPMLLGGDEINRTQRGNNNAWCQDNEISWFAWKPNGDAEQLHAFTQRLIRLRREHCTFRRESFLRGQEVDGSELPDVWWFRTDGHRMTARDWEHGEPVLGMFLNGRAIPTLGPHGERVEDDSFLLLFNAHVEERQFKLPRRILAERWELELTTADARAQPGSVAYEAGELLDVIAHSITILRQVA